MKFTEVSFSIVISVLCATLFHLVSEYMFDEYENKQSRLMTQLVLSVITLVGTNFLDDNKFVVINGLTLGSLITFALVSFERMTDDALLRILIVGGILGLTMYSGTVGKVPFFRTCKGKGKVNVQ